MVRRMTRLHRKFYKVCFLRAAGDGHLAADEKRAQFTHGVSCGEVVAGIIAGDEHRALDADLTTAAHHHLRARGCTVRCNDRQASSTVRLTTCRALLHHKQHTFQHLPSTQRGWYCFQ